MKGTRGLAALAAAGLGSLLSCYMPPYGEGLSAGAGFAETLGQPRLVFGPVDTALSIASSARFVPTRLPTPDSGFVVERMSDSTRLLFLAPGATAGTFTLAELGSTPAVVGPEPFLAFPLPLGPDPELAFPTSASSISRLVLGSAALASTPPLSAAQTEIALASGETLVALGAKAETGSGNDLCAFLVRKAGGVLGVATSALPPSMSPTTLPPAAALAEPSGGLSGGAFFAASASGPFYWGSASGGTVWRWSSAASAPAALGLSDPLVGLLSDGHLVTQGPVYLSVFDQAGAKVFAIDAGNVRFAFELYSESGGIGTQFVALTELIHAAGSGGKTRLAAALWQVPLAEFLAFR